MKSNEFGYIGATPTQSSSSLTGIFSNDDVYNLINEGKWASQDFFEKIGYVETTTNSDVYLALTGLDTTQYSNLKIIID